MVVGLISWIFKLVNIKISTYMIFPFGIEKEAEIYCTSAKVALKSQEKSIGPQIADMANNLIVNGVVDFHIRQFYNSW